MSDDGKTEVEFAGVKFRGGKIFVIITALSTLGGGLYAGFEFWTGEEWSDDADHYRWLCDRDSKVEKTKDLDKIKKHDDKNFFIND